MQNNYTKTYLKGSASEKKFEGGGSVINVSIAKDELSKIPVNKSKSGVEYLVLSIGTRREADEWGNTHSVYVSLKEGDSPSVESDSPSEGAGDGWV